METILKYGRILPLIVCFSMVNPTQGQMQLGAEQQSPPTDRSGSPGYRAPNGPSPAGPGNPACTPDAGDCCVVGGNGTPGCEDEMCCNTVCAADVFCCDTSWDGICADAALNLCGVFCTCGNGVCDLGEDNANCPQDCFCGNGTIEPGEECEPPGTSTCNDDCQILACGVPGTGDCCLDTGTPFCDDLACCNTVCAVDAFCCDIVWDAICAAEAVELCGGLCLPPECDLDPPCSGNLENEGCAEDVNGGCNSKTPVFTAAQCGSFWCGDTWAEGGMRDTDWYLINHAGGLVAGAARSETQVAVFIVDGIATCTPVIVGATGCSAACQTINVASADLPAGEYVVFVAPGTCDGGGLFEGAPCADDDSGENDYELNIGCNPVPACGVPGTGDCCVEGGNGTPFCEDEECCTTVCASDPFCCDTSWDGLCAAVALTSCPALCQECQSDEDCVPGEVCVNFQCIPPPCPPEAAGDCCADNGTPGCEDPACCNTICAADPFCCDTSWDGLCVDFALTTCNVCCPPCRDFNADGVVAAFDLASVLALWGDPGCGGAVPCCQDEDGDGDVDASDLADVLAAWGLCPLPTCATPGNCDDGFVECGVGTPFNCVCWTEASGIGVCIQEFGCEDVGPCGPGNTCPENLLCIVGSCCGPAVCVPPIPCGAPPLAPPGESPSGPTGSGQGPEFSRD